jgi:nonsense-mediated mRNA decay protein 3
MEFIQNHVVVKIKQSFKLVSHNEKTGTVNSKHTIMIDIAPVCKDDLVLLSKELSKKLGGIGPLVLCYKISKSINIVDCVTMETMELDSPSYWKNPFVALMSRPSLSSFVIMNIEKPELFLDESRAAQRNKFKFAEVEVQRDSDFGVNNKSYFTYTHIAEAINYNDTVLGYDLESANFSDDQAREMVTHKVCI